MDADRDDGVNDSHGHILIQSCCVSRLLHFLAFYCNKLILFLIYLQLFLSFAFVPFPFFFLFLFLAGLVLREKTRHTEDLG